MLFQGLCGVCPVYVGLFSSSINIMIRSSPALKGFVDVVDAALLRIREKKNPGMLSLVLSAHRKFSFDN